jgi:transposase
MARNLRDWQHQATRALLCRKFKRRDIAKIANCTTRAVTRIRSNLRYFNRTRAPRPGRRHSVTRPMLNVLRKHLMENPSSYLSEMADLLWTNFRVEISLSTISRTLHNIGWSKKVIRRVAKEQNPDLRDLYLYNLSAFHSNQIVYIDESGCDKREGFRRTGWSPVGTVPVIRASR